MFFVVIPGVEEAIMISKVMQFLESPKYNMCTRIVFDTTTIGHTLHLLSLPNFLDASIGEILKLRQKIASITSSIKSVFGQENTRQDATDKLEKLRERVIKVRELFRDTDSTEFVIVAIPTVMAVTESSRLSASLKKENVLVKRLIANQTLPASASDCKFYVVKIKDQTRALDMIQSDPGSLISRKLTFEYQQWACR